MNEAHTFEPVHTARIQRCACCHKRMWNVFTARLVCVACGYCCHRACRENALANPCPAAREGTGEAPPQPQYPGPRPPEASAAPPAPSQNNTEAYVAAVPEALPATTTTAAAKEAVVAEEATPQVVVDILDRFGLLRAVSSLRGVLPCPADLDGACFCGVAVCRGRDKAVCPSGKPRGFLHRARLWHRRCLLLFSHLCARSSAAHARTHWSSACRCGRWRCCGCATPRARRRWREASCAGWCSGWADRDSWRKSQQASRGRCQPQTATPRSCAACTTTRSARARRHPQRAPSTRSSAPRCFVSCSAAARAFATSQTLPTSLFVLIFMLLFFCGVLGRVAGGSSTVDGVGQQQQASGNVGRIKADDWRCMFDFCTKIPENLEGYDSSASCLSQSPHFHNEAHTQHEHAQTGPCLIDEFVEYLREKRGIAVPQEE